MQAGNVSERGLPLKLQDAETFQEFPPHVTHILSPGKPIPFAEILCRLLHVCLIEVGFIPVIAGEDADSNVDLLGETNFTESVPKLVRSLKKIVDTVGNLHNINYKTVVYANLSGNVNDFPTEETNTSDSPNESTLSLRYDEDSDGMGYNGGVAVSIPVTSKDSGDGSSLLPIDVMKAGSEEVKDNVADLEMKTSAATQANKTFSEIINISIIDVESSIYAVANGPGVQKNFQLSLPQYIRPHATSRFLMAAKSEDFFKLVAFHIIPFINDVKNGFCYPIMDVMNSLSFEIRSLSWLPAELIVEIAKRCSPRGVFQLSATCIHIRQALGSTNQHFWKMMLKRDFPQYNIDRLQSDNSPDKFYRKYIEMSNFLLRRPLRRALGQPRIFPYYLSYFRL